MGILVDDIMHGANYREGTGQPFTVEKSTSKVNHKSKLQNFKVEKEELTNIVFNY